MISGIMAIAAGQAAPKDDPWEKWSFLIGRWTGEGGGVPGQATTGYFSFERDLQGKVLVRKDHSEYPAAKDHPAIVHDSLMIVFRDEKDGTIRASYFDNEGHVIPYTASISADGKTIEFLSDAGASSPRFRLKYMQTGAETLRITFEIAPPGSPEKFQMYVQGEMHRTAGKTM